MSENQPNLSADNNTKNKVVANKATQLKKTWIQIPQEIHQKFEEIRVSNPNPQAKQKFWSKVFLNGLAASDKLIQQQQITQVEHPPAKDEPKIIPPKTAIKIVEKIPLWVKVLGAAGVSVIVLLLFFRTSED